eukprot:15433756-Alexandrium_andersonii.AAC.1
MVTGGGGEERGDATARRRQARPTPRAASWQLAHQGKTHSATTSPPGRGTRTTGRCPCNPSGRSRR